MPLACASWIFEVHVATVAEYEFPTMKCAYTPLGELATARVDSVMFPVGAALTWATNARDSETAARILFNMSAQKTRVRWDAHVWTFCSPFIPWSHLDTDCIDTSIPSRTDIVPVSGGDLSEPCGVSVCGFMHGQPHWPRGEPGKYYQSLPQHIGIACPRLIWASLL